MRQAVEKAKKVKQSVNDGKQHYYSTLFHEMVHSTGTKERCNRDGVTGMNFFGGHEYSKEELVAEIGSAILGAKVGLTSERVMDNTTAYCKSWAKKLKSEPKWIIWAGGQSEKAVNYILEGK
jgi:antirestriction protein ArdC